MLYIPDISEETFSNINQVMHEYVSMTYIDWLNWCENLAGQKGKGGFVRVDVEPAQFEDFIRAHKRLPDLSTLLLFCEKKSSREFGPTRVIERS